MSVGPQDSASSICPDGTTPLTTCGISLTTSRSDFDPTTSKWYVLDADRKKIRAFSTGGTGAMGTLTTLAQSAQTFQFARIGGVPYVYYCATSNGRMYLRNIDTAVEKALPWPITSMSCTSAQQFIYDAANRKLVFPYTQNGLAGVGALTNADPASNGF